MYTRVFLIRHGATVFSAEDRFAGETDIELSDEGREQARKLAERLGTEKIAAVYASPLVRTLETARIVAKPHNLSVVRRDGLREISHGRWEQMTRQEVEEKFPEEAAAWEEDPYTFSPSGGEKWPCRHRTGTAGPCGDRSNACRRNGCHGFAQGDDSLAS